MRKDVENLFQISHSNLNKEIYYTLNEEKYLVLLKVVVNLFDNF